MALPRARLATNWLPKFPVMVPVGACICKRISLTGDRSFAGAIATKETSILFALGETNSSKKSTTRRFKPSWFKVKTQ